ncbi:hypothetical protein LINGRAHAP2_LOCUS10764, partial [Linum grandiflorum]
MDVEEIDEISVPFESVTDVETGQFFPLSETCKSDVESVNWKTLQFKTIEEYQAFYCGYAIEASFSMRITSIVKRVCRRDNVFRVRYPNKSTKQLQGKVQKIVPTIRKRKEEKSIIETTVAGCME